MSFDSEVEAALEELEPEKVDMIASEPVNGKGSQPMGTSMGRQFPVSDLLFALNVISAIELAFEKYFGVCRSMTSRKNLSDSGRCGMQGCLFSLLM